MENITILLYKEHNFPKDYGIMIGHPVNQKRLPENLWPIITETCNSFHKKYVSHYITESWEEYDDKQYHIAFPDDAKIKVPLGVKMWFLHIVAQ